jgi:protocatechuate 3,4-dioxygenase beta subunit
VSLRLLSSPKTWRGKQSASLLLLSILLAACQTSPTGATTSAPTLPLVAAPSSASSALGSPTPPAASLGSPATASTINCSSPAAMTPSMTEGPYFKSGSPERLSLYTQGMAGTKLILTGYVMTTDCRSIAHALLDFWQADAKGNYDNSGYTLRGHQFTDESGRYQLTTIVPGLYPGRTEHIHVKIQAPNGPIITTQLFFPGVTQNQSDSIFDAKLLINTQTTSGGIAAEYNFVVKSK